MSDISSQVARLESRVDSQQELLQSMAKSVQSIERSMREIVRLEERQGETGRAISRAFGRLEKCEERLQLIEMLGPLNKQTRVWVERGVIALVSASATGAGVMVYGG